MADEKFIYVGIMDHVGQRFVVAVPVRKKATAASVAYDRSPMEALRSVQTMIHDNEAIDCEIQHPNNRARMLVIFNGPTRLDVDPRVTPRT